MSVQDLERAVKDLSPDDLDSFAQWFDDYREREWDEQIRRDVRAGRFEPLLQRAREQFDSDYCGRLGT